MRVPVALLALVLLASPAAASWRGPGAIEPDTRHDREDGRMFPHSDLNASTRRVYFHAWQAIEGTSQSPNSATIGTAVLFPEVRHRAMLGVWKDCNRDGYVGHAESALQEYHARLADPGVCAVGSKHNDGLWVSEMIAIGTVDPCEYEPDDVRRRECPTGNPVEPIVPAFAENERVYYSLSTYVWGDVGAPGEEARAECVLAPAPRGTTASTGALLRWADCQDGYLVTRAAAALGQSPPDVAFPVTLLGAPDGRTGLLQQGSEDPAFTVWDCASRQGVQDPSGGRLREVAVRDPSGGRLTGPVFPIVLTGYTFQDDDGDASTGGVLRIPLDADGQGTFVFVPAFAPNAANPTGSWWDAAEAAHDGARGDCDPATRSALQTRHPGHLVEDGDRIVTASKKDRATLTFTFYDGHRGFHKDLDPHTGESTPSDGGLLLHRHGRGGAGPLWSSRETTTHEPQLLRRGDIAPARGVTYTYYARVGPDAISAFSLELPVLASAAYGEEACGTQRSGERNGWICDPALWWLDAFGNDVRPRYARGEALGRVIGDPYDLRDVDCYDGAIRRDLGAYASLVLLAPDGPCAS